MQQQTTMVSRANKPTLFEKKNKSVNNVAKIFKILNIGWYHYIGAVNNVAKIIKVPNIGWYRYMRAIRRHGPAQKILRLRLEYPLRTPNTKFKTIPVNNVAEITKSPKIGSGYRYRISGGTVIWGAIR